MSIFHHVHFQQPDPLDDGTSEAIAHEQREAGIVLVEEDGEYLTDFWNNVSKNLKKESNRIDFDGN